MKKSRILILSLCAVLLVTASVLGTLAYLTSRDSVVNTFTVGQVNIELDEAKVNPDGTPDGDKRVKGNEYHLIPGMIYTKDPTLTVIRDSEESYVRMLVTVNCYNALTDIFGDPFLPQYFVSGWDENTWVSTKVIDVDTAADTATYEFRYYDTVNAKDTVKPDADTDLTLDALFDSITVPGEMTGEELKAIENLKITVVGHAIQAVGFADADAAWAAFDKQVEAGN